MIKYQKRQDKRNRAADDLNHLGQVGAKMLVGMSNKLVSIYHMVCNKEWTGGKRPGIKYWG